MGQVRVRVDEPGQDVLSGHVHAPVSARDRRLGRRGDLLDGACRLHRMPPEVTDGNYLLAGRAQLCRACGGVDALQILAVENDGISPVIPCCRLRALRLGLRCGFKGVFTRMDSLWWRKVLALLAVRLA
jgi:hypothetical protein